MAESSNLSSLMKQNLGVKRLSKLSFKIDDTLYTRFRKLADYVYKNGDWNVVEEKSAALALARRQYRISPLNDTLTLQLGNGKTSLAKVQLTKLEADDSRLEGYGQYQNHAYWSTLVDENNQMRGGGLILLDETSRQATKQGKVYRRRSDGQTITFGTIKRSIGYDHLQNSLMKELLENQNQYDFTVDEFSNFLLLLTESGNGSEDKQYLYTHNKFADLTDAEIDDLEPIKHGRYKGRYRFPSPQENYNLILTKDNIRKMRTQNKMIDFVNDYIEKTYNIIWQQQYERDADTKSRARAWQTKKNINQDTQKVMENTTLRNHFKYVELDNEVDLKQYKIFEKEVNRIFEALPVRQDAVKPTLRLRKLGNYSAEGVYFPNFNTIALDFRDRTDQITQQKGNVSERGGISSFVHEYGHYIDYQLKEGQGPLSVQSAFAPIVASYRQQLNNNLDVNVSYLGAPTEIFARAFELYAYKKGLKSPLLGTANEYETNTAYTAFTPENQDMFTSYFDHVVPKFATAIEQLPQVEITEIANDGISTENEDTKKKDFFDVPYSRSETSGSGLSDRNDKETIQKFASPSNNNSRENGNQNHDNQSVNQNEGTKKKDFFDTPYSRSETSGSGLPDRNDKETIQKFASPSRNYFRITGNKNQHAPIGFHLVTEKELIRLNESVKTIKNIADFYNTHLKDGYVSYVYKSNEQIKLLRVKYGKENFAHLIGLRFSVIKRGKILEELIANRGFQKGIFVKNDGSTFQKLEVLNSFESLISAKTLELNDFSNIPQAQKLRFDQALKTSDKNLMLALKDFEPSIYRPYSLINLNDEIKGYSDYSKVPENKILAVLSEKPNGMGGVSIGTLSINHEYVKGGKQLIEVSQAITMELFHVVEELKQNGEDYDLDHVFERINANHEEELSAFSVEAGKNKSNSVIDPQLSEKDSKKQEDDIHQPASTPRETIRPMQTSSSRYSRNKNRVSNNDKKIAKSRNILEVADKLGMRLKKYGHTYKWIEHDSLTIFPKTNTFKWYNPANEAGGDPIALVQAVSGVDFIPAVRFLNSPDFSGAVPQEFVQEGKEAEFKYLLKDHANIDSAMSYLTKERGLNSTTVRHFYQAGVLAEATRKDHVDSDKGLPELWQSVVAFKSFDENGRLVGAALEGIDKHPERYGEHHPRKKEIIKNSNGQYGISISIGNPKRVVLCESPIDMMSYYELKITRGELKDTLLVSMDGLKESVASNAYNRILSPKKMKNNYLKEVNQYFDGITLKGGKPHDVLLKRGMTITLAVDNDQAGLKLFERMQKQFPNIPIIPDVPPKEVGKGKMDWNDYLKKLKQQGLPLTKELPNTVLPAIEEEVKQRNLEILNTDEKNVMTNQVSLPANNEHSPEDSDKTLGDDFSLSSKEKSPLPPKKYNPQPEKEAAQKVLTTIQTKQMVKTPGQLAQRSTDLIRAYGEANNGQGFGNYLRYLGINPAISPFNAALVQEAYPGTKMALTFKQWQQIGLENNIKGTEVMGTYIDRNGHEKKQKHLIVRRGERSSARLIRPQMTYYIPALRDNGQIIFKTDKHGEKVKVWKDIDNATPIEQKMIKEGRIKAKKGVKRNAKGKGIYASYPVFALEQTSLRPDAYQRVLHQHDLDFSSREQVQEMELGLIEIAENEGLKIHYADKINPLSEKEKWKLDTENKQLIVQRNEHNPQVELATVIDAVAYSVAHYEGAINDKVPKQLKRRSAEQAQLEGEMLSFMTKERYGVKQDVSDQRLTYWARRFSRDQRDGKESDTHINKVAARLSKDIKKVTECLDQHAKKIQANQQHTRGQMLDLGSNKGISR